MRVSTSVPRSTVEEAADHGGVVVGAFARACGRTARQCVERVQDRLARQDTEHGAAETGQLPHLQDALRGVVVENDAVVTIADDHALGEIEQDRFELAALLGGGACRL